MTIQAVLNEVDELKPNQYKTGTKIGWISVLDKKVYNDIISREGYDGPEPEYSEYSDMDTELLVPDAYGDLYAYYIMSLMEFNDGETERYMNSSQMFNVKYDEFIGWYYYTHRQKR